MHNRTPKIKMCHISTRFLRGGGAKNTFLTIKGLDKDLFDIHLIIGRDVYWNQLDQLENIKIIQLKSLVRDPHIIQDIRCLFSLFKIIKKNRYDIVHTHIAKAGFIGRLAAWAAGVPIIIHSIHGITFPPTINAIVRKLYIILEKVAASITTHFIPVGTNLRASYLEKRIGRPDQHTVIRSGMDLRYFRRAKQNGKVTNVLRKELRIAPTDVVIGYVAALEPRKGHLFAIIAAERIVKERPDAKFLFVGEGDLKDELIEITLAKGLENNVILTGYRNDIAEVMALFDVKMFTSLWEGLPQVLVQSCTVGIPIVSFDTNGVREIVEDGYNGFVVPMKDVDALIERICLLLNNKTLAVQMGLNGRAIVGKEWEVSTMVGKTSKLYQSLWYQRARLRR